MAFAAISDLGPTTQEEREVIEYILDHADRKSRKSELKHTKYHNVGVESHEFKQLAGKFSEALFHKFYDFAEVHLTRKLPLLITGGC
jgi:hydroxymethyl cephem carbamoyltransferase